MKPATPTRADLDAIAGLCDENWDHYYTRAKLRSDPVYAAVMREIVGTEAPLLDIGCGIGLLSHYLHACGHAVPFTGFDYDERKIASAQAMATKARRPELIFTAGDARHGLPTFSGHVVILDILQFFTEAEQDRLLSDAAARVARGCKLIIRSGLQDDTWRFRLTVLGDYLARLTFWMKAGPTRYPDAEQFRRVLTAAGLEMRIEPMWGGTPFNNYLIVGSRKA